MQTFSSLNTLKCWNYDSGRGADASHLSYTTVKVTMHRMLTLTFCNLQCHFIHTKLNFWLRHWTVSAAHVALNVKDSTVTYTVAYVCINY